MKPNGSATGLGDFNLVVENGFYSCNPQSMSNKPSTPSTQASLWVWCGGGTDSLGLQILWDNGDPTQNGKVFMRTRYNETTWKSWVVVGTDYPLFYKNYNSLASLKTALGVDGVCRSFNITGSSKDVFDTGISVNQYNGGLTALAIMSTNTGDGTATRSEIGVYQFYYSGNNAPAFTHLHGDTDFFTSYSTVTDNKTLAFVKKRWFAGFCNTYFFKDTKLIFGGA